MKEKFGVEKITISLGENAPLKRAGFYRSSDGRVEIGYQEIINLIEGKVGVTPKHEIRHAIFENKKISNAPSVYQIRFKASQDGKLLNEKMSYDQYMSSEEIYNWSTDLQTYAQQMKGTNAEDLIKHKLLLKPISHKNNGLITLTETGSSLPDGMINNLQKMIQEKNYTTLKLYKYNEFSFLDDQERMTIMSLVGDERIKLYSSITTARLNLENGVLDFSIPKLTKRGLSDPHSDEYLAAMKQLKQYFSKTPKGLELQSRFNDANLELAKYAINRLNDLKKISQAQRTDALLLKGLISKFEDPITGGTPEQLIAIKKQMFTIGRNVKEEYKDSILKATVRNGSSN